MISVVMASYLGEYKSAAKNRDIKIRRAVESVLSQTVPVELVVVADGCHLPFIDKAFDVCVSVDTIEHIPKSIRPNSVLRSGVG